MSGVGPLRSGLLRMTAERPAAPGATPRGHPLDDFARRAWPRAMRRALGAEWDDIVVRGSVGQRAWAAVPWLGFFDPLVTTSAQRGHHVVVLIGAGTGRAHLALIQGTQAVLREFGPRRGREVLRARAGWLRARLLDAAGDLSADPIDLGAPGDLPRGYEAAHLFGRTLDLGDLPAEGALMADLVRLLRLDRMLTARGGLWPTDALIEAAGTDDLTEARRRMLSRRLEADPRTRRAALRGRPVCEACGLDPAAHYGLGPADARAALDLHHLRPPDGPEDARPAPAPDDFAVLCPSCHRAAHLSDAPGDLAALRRAVRFRRMTEVGP